MAIEDVVPGRHDDAGTRLESRCEAGIEELRLQLYMVHHQYKPEASLVCKRLNYLIWNK